jgi:C4-dicarboxylate-specific signal transduction histidine kinase
MPKTVSDLDERRARIAAKIAAAEARLAKRTAGVDMGDLIKEINDDLDRVAHEDRDEADRAYDRIEARLAAERIRLEDDAEEEDR